MRLPRLHLFELVDQPWYPATLRDLTTDYLFYIETKFSLHLPVVALLGEALNATQNLRIIDLGSGAAGPTLALTQSLAEAGIDVALTLTDRFPNLQAFQQVAAVSHRRIMFEDEPVDARAVPRRLQGFRTMFNAFHHFRPDDAILILRDAAEAGQPIGIFEIPDRTLRTLVPLLLLTPLMVALATPFIRPFRWQRILWTYVIPLVPLTCWWDGVISQLRAYGPSEIEQLAKAVPIKTYSWRAGQVPIQSTPGNLTYLIGYPTGEHGKNVS